MSSLSVSGRRAADGPDKSGLRSGMRHVKEQTKETKERHMGRKLRYGTDIMSRHGDINVPDTFNLKGIAVNVSSVICQRHRIVSIGFLSLCLFASDVTFAQISERRIPVSMSLDRDEYASSLFIKCKAESLGGAKVDSLKDSTEPVISGFYGLIQDIRGNDAVAFKATGRGFRGNPGDRAEQNLAGFRGLLKSYDDNGDGVKVYDHLIIGGGGMVVWGCDKNKSKPKSFTQRRVFNYEIGPAGEMAWGTAIDQPDVRTSVITHSLEQAAKNPQKYAEKVKAGNSKYSIALPGTEGENAAYLEFGGKVYNGVDVIHESVPAEDKVLSFYKEACLARQTKATDEFADYYTARSRKVILEWLSKDPNALNGYRRELSKPRRILFIMDADPFYVVFYMNDRIGTMDFEYIVRDTADDRLKLTSVNVVDLTTQYFMSEEFRSIMNKVLVTTPMPSSVKKRF
jgi:hypothetical protein